MPEWLKALFMIVGLGGWLATIVATLLRGELPDPTLLGIPAALVIALAPPITIGRGNDREPDSAPRDGTETS